MKAINLQDHAEIEKLAETTLFEASIWLEE